MTLFFAFVFGALVGSFLNVCIFRLPAGQSIAFPPSNCPGCAAPIRPYDNIPIVSYLILRGKCRKCGIRISPRYPFVELLTGFTATATCYFFGPTLAGLVYFAFLSALIVITFIDLDHQIIPNVISLPGIPLGVLAAVILGKPAWLDSIIGLLVGGGLLWAVAEGYYRLTGRDGMGGGDVKLLAMIGAFLGWRAIPVTLMFASLTGTVIGFLLMAISGGDRRMAIPFGPFLAAGAVVALFAGEPLIGWYLEIARP